MAIIPIVRCSRIRPSVEFYTKVLDFRLADDDELTDPAYIFLTRAGDALARAGARGSSTLTILTGTPCS